MDGARCVRIGQVFTLEYSWLPRYADRRGHTASTVKMFPTIRTRNARVYAAAKSALCFNHSTCCRARTAAENIEVPGTLCR